MFGKFWMISVNLSVAIAMTSASSSQGDPPAKTLAVTSENPFLVMECKAQQLDIVESLDLTIDRKRREVALGQEIDVVLETLKTGLDATSNVPTEVKTGKAIEISAALEKMFKEVAKMTSFMPGTFTETYEVAMMGKSFTDSRSQLEKSIHGFFIDSAELNDAVLKLKSMEMNRQKGEAVAKQFGAAITAAQTALKPKIKDLKVDYNQRGSKGQTKAIVKWAKLQLKRTQAIRLRQRKDIGKKLSEVDKSMADWNGFHDKKESPEPQTEASAAPKTAKATPDKYVIGGIMDLFRDMTCSAIGVAAAYNAMTLGKKNAKTEVDRLSGKLVQIARYQDKSGIKLFDPPTSESPLTPTPTTSTKAAKSTPDVLSLYFTLLKDFYIVNGPPDAELLERFVTSREIERIVKMTRLERAGATAIHLLSAGRVKKAAVRRLQREKEIATIKKV